MLSCLFSFLNDKYCITFCKYTIHYLYLQRIKCFPTNGKAQKHFRHIFPQLPPLNPTNKSAKWSKTSDSRQWHQHGLYSPSIFHYRPLPLLNAHTAANTLPQLMPLTGITISFAYFLLHNANFSHTHHLSHRQNIKTTKTTDQRALKVPQI